MNKGKEELYQTLKIAVDGMIEGIQIIARDWRYLYVNKAAANQGHLAVKDLLGRTMQECYPGIEETPLFKSLKYVMETRNPHTLENEFIYPSGDHCWFELFIEPHEQGILIRSMDVSKRKHLEEQLLYSHKMDEIGRLSGSIGHDFNNKLAVLMAYTEMIKKSINENKPVKESYFEKIEKALQQSSELTDQLLTFSREQVFDPQFIDLNSALENSVQKLSRHFNDNIKIDFRLQSDIHPVWIDPLKFNQMLFNLCSNAKEAMPNGGVLTICTSLITTKKEENALGSVMVPGDYIFLTIADTGIGMNDTIISKVFDPFFTTKELGPGVGFGLSTVYGIIKQSHAHINVSSEVGQGSEFKIYFPVICQLS